MKSKKSFWSTWPGICAIALIAALAFFLVTEHTAHLFGVLPYGFLLLCPLMHFFMHRGHGSHGRDTGPDNKGDAGSSGGHQH